MSEDAQKYEVFIESVEGCTDNETTQTNWSWRRLNEVGEILVRGSLHGSLEACFASVKRHSVTFGQAPVKINLHEPRRRHAVSPR
jgi:hypothetical protein